MFNSPTGKSVVLLNNHRSFGSFFNAGSLTKADILKVIQAMLAPQLYSYTHPGLVKPSVPLDEKLFGLGNLETPAKLKVAVDYFDNLARTEIDQGKEAKGKNPQMLWRQKARLCLQRARAYLAAADVLENEIRDSTSKLRIEILNALGRVPYFEM